MSAVTPQLRLACHLRDLASNTRKAIPTGNDHAIDVAGMLASIDFAERVASAIERMPVEGIAGELTFTVPSAQPIATTGQVGFDAYGGHGPNPWKTWNGGDMPRWPALGETEAGQVTRSRWAAAGAAEITAYLNREDVAAIGKANRDAVRALVEALPKCLAELGYKGDRALDARPNPATKRVGFGSRSYCDAHATSDEHAVDLPHAVPLRALLALMATWSTT